MSYSKAVALPPISKSPPIQILCQIDHRIDDILLFYCEHVNKKRQLLFVKGRVIIKSKYSDDKIAS